MPTQVGNSFEGSELSIVVALGGLNGWIGEGSHCNAFRFISLDRLPKPAILNETDVPPNSISTRIKFRRLFADGLALAKFEMGFSSGLFLRQQWHKQRDWGISYDFSKMIRDVLTLPCSVRGAAASGPLLYSGKFLAARYSECTTKRSVGNQQTLQSEDADEIGRIVAGDPLVFIDCSSREIDLPKGYRQVSMPGNFDFQLIYGSYPSGSFRVPVWILVWNGLAADARAADARHLRIYLQRIHAEKEVLRAVLDHIACGKLKPDAGHASAETLQRYLLESTNRIGRLELKADKKATEGIGALAASCLQFVQPGWRDALTQRLDVLNVRPNIKRNIDARVINYGNINLDLSQHDIRWSIQVGDVFSNIQNSKIFNHSALQNAFNKIKSDAGDSTAEHLLKVAELVAQSGNTEAGELLDQFNEELSKPQPRKSLLKRSWDGLVAALPAITSIAGAAAAIAGLFS
jgi:hypothetical protein